jgi:alcohol dehydrogenase class IV
LVIWIGGGSAIDLAKTVSGLLTNRGSLLDYLEVVGKGQALRNPAAPMIAVPTTAGTGAEVIANAVIKDPVNKQKVSLRSPFLVPEIALIDPELTYSLSPGITAQRGLDALIHLMETYTSKRALPLSYLFCKDGLNRAGRSLVKTCQNGSDQDAREDMALAALEGGIVLANAGLGAVHGFAGVLGGAYSIPHRLACAYLLPSVFEANIRKLRSKKPDHPLLKRYVEVTWVLRRKR